jgi:hypothetical protein
MNKNNPKNKSETSFIINQKTGKLMSKKSFNKWWKAPATYKDLMGK